MQKKKKMFLRKIGSILYVDNLRLRYYYRYDCLITNKKKRKKNCKSKLKKKQKKILKLNLQIYYLCENRLI